MNSVPWFNVAILVVAVAGAYCSYQVARMSQGHPETWYLRPAEPVLSILRAWGVVMCAGAAAAVAARLSGSRFEVVFPILAAFVAAAAVHVANSPVLAVVLSAKGQFLEYRRRFLWKRLDLTHALRIQRSPYGICIEDQRSNRIELSTRRFPIATDGPLERFITRKPMPLESDYATRAVLRDSGFRQESGLFQLWRFVSGRLRPEWMAFFLFSIGFWVALLLLGA